MEPRNNFQNQISERVQAFVAEITELARQHALTTLAAALDTQLPGLAFNGRRRSGKRSSSEIRAEAERLLGYIQDHPGQRMEDIAKETGITTKDLSLPIKKLLGESKVTTEGQKRATRYFPAGAYSRKRRPGARKKKRAKSARSSARTAGLARRNRGSRSS